MNENETSPPQTRRPEVSTLATTKPDFPITSHPAYDYDLGDRVVRALEHSPLHVVGASVVVALPESRQAAAIEEMYGPNPPPFAFGEALTQLELVLVTDGEHGWLVLVDAKDDHDAEAEMAELMAEVLAGQPASCVVRAVSDFGAPAAGALDLTVREERRARIEAEYARLLGESEAAPAADVLSRLQARGFALRGEAEIREMMNEASEEPPAPPVARRPPEPEPPPSRAGRRGIGFRRARRRRSRRPRRR